MSFLQKLERKMHGEEPLVSKYGINHVRHLYRRRIWVLGKISPKKVINLFKMFLSLFLGKIKLSHLPFVLKVDVTPNCQLECPVCVHGESDEIKSSWNFRSKNMTLELFEKIITEVKGVTSALSLYYLGEPFMNKNLVKMIELADKKNFVTFVSSNYSFNFNHNRIEQIVNSGLTKLTVCLDGMTQDVYGRTRVNGRLEYVLKNLENTQQYKSEKHREFPLLEIQYLRYPHNLHQIPEAKRLASTLKVDHLEIFNGNITPWSQNKYTLKNKQPREKSFLPKCFWPWVSMVIKWNGDVIPCCRYRFDEQYDESLHNKHILGNVMEKCIKKIWNSEPYQQIRDMVINTSKYAGEENKDLFCYGCNVIYK